MPNVLTPTGITAIQHACNVTFDAGLTEDGEKGPLTDTAFSRLIDIYDAGITAPAASDGPGAFALALATVAESQIGTQEDAAHSNRGNAILKYQQATNLGGQGWPWCAAFVDWCFQAAASATPAPAARPKGTLQRPETASAFGLITWAGDQGLPTLHPPATPQRGDIVVYTFSHTGIVTGYTGGETFATVEGNTNDQGGSDGYEVARRTRSFGTVKAFIRLA